MGHGHRGLFVTARDELRRFVAAVVDDAFVDPTKTRARIRGDVVDVQLLDDVDHEIAAWAIGGEHVDFAGGVNLSRQRWRCAGARWSALLRGRLPGGAGAADQCGGPGNGRTLQKTTTVDRQIL